ncbi:MAG: thioredoxin [Synechococcales cyanobacterium RM1_1_8]|nr:thioredoxin [Synechococcales cyanobacterium RM1_1_8]
MSKQQFDSFDAMLANSDKPTLVDFYAPWCGPCQMMAGILKQVKEQLGDQVNIVKINTDNYPHIASEHRIEALPTLVLFKDGKASDRIEGVLRPEQLVARLQPNLG